MRTHSSWLVRLYLWACQRLYHELAWSYDSVSWLISLGRWPAWRRVALEHFAPHLEPGGARVLELGFGTGELLVEMARRGLAPIGLEPSPAMHQIAESKLCKAGLQARRLYGQARSLPFACASFDIIVSTFPAAYILDEQTLRECARLLTPAKLTTNENGGRLIVVGLWVTLKSSWLRRSIPLFYGRPPIAWIAQIEQRLSAAGFHPEWSVYEDDLARVPVLIAQRI